MLESLAATLLNRLLGSYVENFDPTQLNVGIWSGDVKLRNLKLRKDCLDGLNLPIDVKYGILGELVLNVPWSSLKNKPVKISVEDCYILCSPRDMKSVDVQEQLERELRMKLRRLAEWELTEQTRVSLQEPGQESGQNETFMQSLITKIVDNLQIQIKNIHIRYEDMLTVFSKDPCSIGVSLNELSAVSTDSNWTPSFISITQSITHKLLTLNSLCLYYNTNSHTIEEDEEEIDNDILFAKLKNSVAAGGSVIPNFQYILRPVTGEGQLSVNKLGSTDEKPHIELKMLYDEFGVELDDSEYADILHTLSSIHLGQKTLKFTKFRPNYSVSENPTGWFKYAATCVVEEIKEKNRMWVWDNIKERCDQRRQYIDLWMKKLELKDLEENLPDKNDERNLEELQEKLDYDSIILFRTVAKRKYAKIKISSRSIISPAEHSKQSGGWFSSWWGTGTNEDQHSDDLILTDEQRQELYDAIDFTEGQDDFSNTIIPTERVTMKITSLLKRGAFSIKRKLQESKLTDIVFENCEVDFLQRPDSFLASFKLQEFKVEDGSTNTIYKHIISVKKQKSKSGEIVDDVSGPLFEVDFESNPLDKSADSKLDVTLRGMTIFYHVHFINEIIRFFNPPKQHLDTIGAIINAAEATVEGWTTQTRMGIESLLEEHKTVNVTMDLQAPLIIIPLNPHVWDTPCAVIDAGHIALVSDLVPKEEITRLKEMTPDEYSKIDNNELNKLMFDRFQLYLQDTQILIGPDIRKTITSLDSTKSTLNYSILSGLLLELTLELSILPKAYNLPKLKAYAHLPKLKLSLNDYQYKIMMQLLEKCTPTNIDMIPDDDIRDVSEINDGFSNNEQLQLQTMMKVLNNMSQLELSQDLIDLQLDIDRVQIALFKCTDENSMGCRKLIDIIGEKLKLDFKKRAKEMELHLRMHSLEIEDFIETHNDELLNHLVSSNILNTPGVKDLFTVDYKREQRIVQHRRGLIEVFDQDIFINMAQLQVVLTPTSILTLMNFALTTFTDPSAPEMPADVLRHNKENRDDAPQKLTMSVDMAGMVIILNDDSIKLATLVLSAAEFSMFLLPEKMKVNTRLGGLELTDDSSQSLPSDSVFRRVISMTGKDLAELSYETFDPSNNPHDYDSILRYNTGSMNINFVEQSINKLVNFFYKFQRMKTVFDTAREVAYNQAPSMDSVNNMKLDISIKAPIIQFPKLIDPKTCLYDSLKFYLGEFFIENRFSGGESQKKINHIEMGIRDAGISSNFNFESNMQQDLHIVEKMALTFSIDHDPFNINESAEFRIKSHFDPLIISLTELQLHYLVVLSEAVTAAFAINESNTVELNEDILNANAFLGSNTPSRSVTPYKADDDEPSHVSNRAKLDFSFEAPEISLVIYNETSGIQDLSKCGLTKLTFQDIAVSVLCNNDSTGDGESHIASFTIEDIRDSKANKHTELIPKVLDDNYQFMASYSSKKLENGVLMNLSVTIDSPQVILAMDYLFALKEFIDFALAKKAADISTPADDNKSKRIEYTPKKPEEESSGFKLQYSLNVVNAAVMLLADPSDWKSEAVIFNVGQFLISDQNITSISANNVGMSLSRMNCPEENKVDLLDEFSSSIVIDKRDSTPDRLLTSVQVSVGPLILGISLRDIRLAMMIFNRLASQMNTNGDDKAGKDDSSLTYGMFSKEFEKKLSKYAPSFVSSINALSSNADDQNNLSDIVLRGEKLNAEFGGLRLFLIGDVHEMPILDMNIAAFQTSVQNWSTDIDALASIEAYINVFNYSRSSWEPLVETFPVTFHLAKGKTNEDAKMAFDIVSRKMAEITLSSRCIAMFSQIPSTLTGDISLKPRGALKPYRIINDSGLDLDIWILTDSPEEKKGLKQLKIGTTMPWEFEDWRRAREILDQGHKDTTLVAAVSGGKYKSHLQVDATSEGEFLFTLEPSVNDVHNRIICQLELGSDNVKTITFRSSLLLENTTSTIIQFMIQSNGNVGALTYDILPNERRSVPVEYAYNSLLKIRPMMDGYEWSSRVINWRDMLTNSLSLECKSTLEMSDKFYFEVNTKYDEKEPLTKIYPHMTLIFSSPLIIQNTLPCDINYCLYDKGEGEKKIKSLKKGSKVEIHDVSLENFLLMRIKPLVDESPLSKPIIINTARNSMLKPELKISCELAGGQTFKAAIHYQSIEGTRAKIIRLSAPYIILNSTDRDLYIQGDYNNIAQVKIQMRGDERYTLPKMFSFENNDNNQNRARIRFKESDWSIPLSFDAIGQSLDTVVNIPNKEQESNIGITISEGEGDYMLSKIIEIAPRYIIQNCLPDPIEVCEHGSTNAVSLEPNTSIPLYKMRNIMNKQLMIKFLGSSSEWSSPFFIKDIGLNHIKVLKQNSTHVLLKIEIVLEKATVFIRLKDAENRWPYSIRNFSDEEFVFYQRDPRVVDDYYDYDPEDDLGEVEYKPLYYRVPPKSVMPYAWDYPAARQKKLLLTARGRRREIQLAQIGNLKPMRLPARVSNEETRTVDLNVIADGSTQALVITNYNPEVSLYKLRTKNTSSSLSINSGGDGFEVDEEDKNIYNRIVVSFKGIGISLVNTSLEEIMYIHTTGLELRYNESDLYQSFSWKLRWIQIDNQLFGGPFQNILYPVAVPHTAQEIENHPVVSGSISKVKDDSHGLIYFKHATLLLQELSIQLDEDLILAVLDFAKFPGASWTDSSPQMVLQEQVTLPECQDIKLSEDMYFEIFHVQPMMLHLSFVRSDEHQLLSKEKNESSVANRGALLFLLDILTMTLANVNDAPIKLNSLYMANVRVPLSSLLQAVQTHYGQQFFYQVHKIIGSADFLGNPVGLFNTISSGVWDIFYEPYQGYMMNDRPQELGINLAKGGLSFAKKTVFGLSDSVAKFTGSMAKGLSITQGSQFQEQRRLQRRVNTNSRNILSSSAQNFANTISSGLTGVALDPMTGAQQEGTAGFLKGVGKGLVGLPAKTVIGLLDLTSSLSQGVRSTATALDGPSATRFRLPRYIDYEDKIVKPFNLREAQGQYWLKVVSGGLYIKDNYLAHVVLPGRELVVIVSMEHIIELNLVTMETMWETTYRSIQGIVLQKGGIHIKLKTQSEFFIPITDPQERRRMYKHIAVAVTEYNKYCEASL